MAINFTHIPRTFESAIEMTPSDIFPVVLIGSVSRVEDNPGYHNRDKFIFLSTKSVNLKHTGSVLADSNDKPVQFDPYLLNIPSIRESIDIKDHSYKVGSVKLDISNHLMDLENTMSDKFYQEGFFGQKVRLYFATKSTEYFAFNPYKISDADEYDKSAYLVFVGTISGVTHDKSKLTITLDDATQNKFDTMLPKKIVKRIDNVNFNEQITKDIGKFYPMCYGDVDYAPTVITQDPNSSRRLILNADSEKLEGTVSKIDPLFIYKEDYVRVPKERKEFKDNYFKTQYEFDLDESNKDVINFDKVYNKGNPINSQSTSKFEVIATRTPRSVTYSNNYPSSSPGSSGSDFDGLFSSDTFTNHGDDEVGNTAIETFNYDLNRTLEEKSYHGIDYDLEFNTGNPFFDVYNIIGSNSFKNHPIYGYSSMKALAPMNNLRPSMCYLYYNKGDDSSVSYLDDSNAEILEQHEIFRDQKDIQITLSALDISSEECDTDSSSGAAFCRHIINFVASMRLRLNDAVPGSGNYMLHNLQSSLFNTLESKIQVRVFSSRKDPSSGVGEVDFSNAPSKKIFETSFLSDIANYNDSQTDANEDAATNVYGGPYDYSIDTDYIVTTDENLHRLDTTGSNAVKNPQDLQDITLSLRFVGDDKYWFQTTAQWDITSFYFRQHFEMNNFYTQDMYMMTRGRQVSQELYNSIDDEDVVQQTNVNSAYLQSAHAIISDIVTRDLGFDGQIDTDSYKLAAQDRSKRYLAFSVNKEIEAKELIQEISKTSKLYPRFKSNGMFTFETIIHHPLQSHYEDARIIQNADCIKYSYSKTPISDVVSRVKIRYHKDYAKDELVSETEWLNPNDTFTEWKKDFYGFKQEKESELIFETEYLRDRVFSSNPEIVKTSQSDDTQEEDRAVINLHNFLLRWYCNQHIIIKVVLPVNFMTIEVGDLVRFKDLLGGVKAFGIDYTTLDEINGQNTYPLFFVTSTKKSINNIELECVQYHNISGIVDDFYKNLNDDVIIYEDGQEPLIYGCLDPLANNYNPDANINNMSCEYDSFSNVYDEEQPTPLLTEALSLYGDEPIIIDDVNIAKELITGQGLNVGLLDNIPYFNIGFLDTNLILNPSSNIGIPNLEESFFVDNDSSYFVSLKHSVDSGGEVEGEGGVIDIDASGIDFTEASTLSLYKARLALPIQIDEGDEGAGIHLVYGINNHNEVYINDFDGSEYPGNFIDFPVNTLGNIGFYWHEAYSTFKINLKSFWETINPEQYPQVQEYWEQTLQNTYNPSLGATPLFYMLFVLRLQDINGNSMFFGVNCKIPFPPYNNYIDNYSGDYGNFYVLGDMNVDGGLNVLDIVALINHVLVGSDDSVLEQIADVNEDGGVNILDVVRLINYVLSEGA